MATRLWVEIKCARCAVAGPGQHVSTSRLPRKELKDLAAQAGWRFEGNDAYCSARCLEDGIVPLSR